MAEDNVTPIEQAKRRGRRPAPPKPRTELPPLQDGSQVPANRPGKVTKAKRRADVLTLAVAGHRPGKIAELLSERYKGMDPPQPGMSPQSVGKIINTALTEWRESDESKVDNVRAMQLSRLDELLAGIYAKAREGKTAYIDRVLKLEALRSKIAGTEAPRRIDVSGNIGLGVSAEDLAREQEAWAAAGGDVINATAIDDQRSLPAGAAAE